MHTLRIFEKACHVQSWVLFQELPFQNTLLPVAGCLVIAVKT